MTQDQGVPAMPEFLAHGGEMGALISAQDWQPTQLGALQGWPTFLKCTLATILGSTKPMYILWGPDLLFFFNDAYAPMLGARVDGAMGQPFVKVWPELWADFEAIINTALRTQGANYQNMPLTLMRNGYPEHTWWTFSYIPLRDECGAVVGAHCIVLETTEQVRVQEMRAAEQKRQIFWVTLTEALRTASEPQALMAVAAQNLGQYLQAGCVGYAEIDETSTFAVVSQDWTAEGFPSAAGTHRLDDFGFLMAAKLRAGQTVVVHDIDHDPLFIEEACSAAYEARGKKAFIDVPLVKNGRFAAIVFVLNAEPRVWRDAEQALVEDVAERTWSALQRLQAELNLRKTNNALDQRTTELLRSENALRQSQKLDALGQLTGGVAHDFNNMLAVISTSVELLRKSALTADQRSLCLDRIFNTVARGVKLTGQLLAFSRRQPLSPQVFDVNQCVQGVLDLVRPLMGKGVQIHLDTCREKGCFAVADLNQFETALVNLMLNARDAMQAEGEIIVKLQPVDSLPGSLDADPRAGNFIAISLSDTGCGIAADKLEAIFEPFYTTKQVGKGTGLGLSQVFGFAKQSGGDIEVMSAPGAGSVFTLYLASAEAPAPSALAALTKTPQQQLTPLTASTANTPGISVLVVEDNQMLGQVTCQLLSTLGHHTVWVANAAAALDALARQCSNFDVVFSDVVMLGMNGIALGEQVRKRYPGIPVVLTSGYNAVMAEEGWHGFEVILKPYTAETLVRVFRKAIAALT